MSGHSNGYKMKKRKYKQEGIKRVTGRPGGAGRWTRGISTWDWMSFLSLVFYSFSSREATGDLVQLPKHRPPVPSDLPGLQAAGLWKDLWATCQRPRMSHRSCGISNGGRRLCLGKRIPPNPSFTFFFLRKKNGLRSLEPPDFSNLIGDVKAHGFAVSSATAKCELLILWAITPAVSGEVT